MKKTSQIAGLCGIVLFLFGIVEFLFNGRSFTFFTYAHVGAGIVLIVLSLVFNLGGFRSALTQRSTRYSANAILYTVIFLAILVLLNVVSNAHSWRKDLTEAGIFSLSSQSKKVLDNLKADVEVLAFFQEGKGSKLEDLLKNYAYYSPKFKYQMIDPVKHPETAKEYEVTQTDIIVVKCGPRNTKITGTTEEDVTNAILKVAKQEQKKVYFLTGHGERDIDDQNEQGYEIVKKSLENESYLVEKLLLMTKKDVPEDCAVLVVAGPSKALEQAELEAIGRYVEKGGHALFLLDPASAPGMEDLLKKWGVKVGNNVIVDQVFRLFYGPSLGVDPLVETYGSHEITRDFKGQTLFHMARSVEPASDLPKDVSAVSLVKTSDRSWAETDLERFFKKSEVSRGPDDIKGPVSIAVALSIDVAKEKSEKEHTEAPDEEGAGRKAKVVVVGDSDFIDNRYITKVFNGDFFLNTMNWLSGEEALIAIRPKAPKGSRVAMTPQQTRDIFYLSVLILPEALLLLGLGIWWQRR